VSGFTVTLTDREYDELRARIAALEAANAALAAEVRQWRIACNQNEDIPFAVKP
jgi:hypothetical protein